MLLEHGHVITGDEGSRRGCAHHWLVCSSLAVASVSHSSSRGSSRQMRCHSPLRTHQTHEVGSICSNLQAGEGEGKREGEGRGRGRGSGGVGEGGGGAEGVDGEGRGRGGGGVGEGRGYQNNTSVHHMGSESQC